jgi:Protein of unknown function (DUF3891)
MIKRMLRMASETGWWLITHPDHARLAGDFAAAWGNECFRHPEPRARVLKGVSCHDDGWASRDAHPVITRQGKPSAFSVELVGRYSAFEEIDLAEYLAVRERAVRIIAEEDAYAGLLISMHTYNLLTEHVDRSTIVPGDLPALDAFLEQQRRYQKSLRADINADPSLTVEEQSEQRIDEHFCLLQACDNLSLLACIAYSAPSHLLHALPKNDGTSAKVQVLPLGSGHFQLNPWPFSQRELRFEFPAHHVRGKFFNSSAELESAFKAAHPEQMKITLCE